MIPPPPIAPPALPTPLKHQSGSARPSRRALFEARRPFGELGRPLPFSRKRNTCAPCSSSSAHSNIIRSCQWLGKLRRLLQPSPGPASRRPSIMVLPSFASFASSSRGFYLGHLPTCATVCHFSSCGDEASHYLVPGLFSSLTRVTLSSFCGWNGAETHAMLHMKVAHAGTTCFPRQSPDICSGGRPAASRSAPAAVHRLNIGYGDPPSHPVYRSIRVPCSLFALVM